jgi:hypothetical protein
MFSQINSSYSAMLSHSLIPVDFMENGQIVDDDSKFAVCG